MNVDSTPEPNTIYEFGDFRLDARRRLLFSRHAGEELRVKPKLVEALLYFVEHRGELLRKDRLMADLWPGQVVEENNLTQLISTLRDVLGETPRENRYLSTVPGRGYRFVANVVQSHEQDEAATLSPVDSRRTPSRRPATLLVVAALTAAAAFIPWYWRASSVPSPATPVAAIEPDPAAVELSSTTVAVLPFASLSADEENAYIALGLAEGVLHRLANIRGLTVIARTSSFAFRDKAADAGQIGRALKARYLVEGSVQRSNDVLRATAQLIDATTGGHMWSLRFDRTVDDIFAIEDEIATAVAHALQVSLSEHGHPYARFGTQAYLAFLRARSLIATGHLADAELAVERFSEAIEIAPDFAAAYVALADAYRHIGYLKAHGPGLSPVGNPSRERVLMEQGGDRAGPLLAKALEMDDTLPEAYILRADLKTIAGDYVSAEDDFRKGLALHPNYGVGHERYAEFLRRRDRAEEALAEIDKAILVDPVAPRNYYFKGHLYLGWPEDRVFGEKAEPFYLKALEVDPEYYPALLRIGVIRWYRGQFAEAVMLGEQALAIDPRADWMRWFVAQFYLELDDAGAARSVLGEATESPEAFHWLALCQYEGKLAEAVELLLAAPGSAVGIRPHYAFVLRDAALASGELVEGRRALLDLPTVNRFVPDNPYRMLALAHLTVALGDRNEGENLARQAAEHDDAYTRAAALTLLGEKDTAIDILEANVDDGVDSRWWYYFSRDPALAPLRGDPRFRALAARAQAHAAVERQRLEELRERGDVVARPRAHPPGTGPC